MKVAIMGGAYVNSGDFLIEQRSKELIETIADSDVDILKRNISYNDKLDKLNNYDVIVFAGGPIFQFNIYPRRIPFVNDIQRIKVPIRILGGGWKGHSVSEKDLYKNYKFTKEMQFFISTLAKQYPLGCRDWYTIRSLQRSGISNSVMIGCPAWYDINKIQKLKLKDKYSNSSINDNVMIGISDPALKINKPYFYELINIMRNNYPSVKLLLFFHRGIDKEDLEKVNEMCQSSSNITFVDMSGSHDSFVQYNQCFMHIGFRVHAHIYNLSQGNVSILLNEDARGVGVNHALGIENINCLLGGANRFMKRINSELFEIKVLDYIRYIEQSNYAQYHRAFWQIRESFGAMETFIAKMT